MSEVLLFFLNFKKKKRSVQILNYVEIAACLTVNNSELEALNSARKIFQDIKKLKLKEYKYSKGEEDILLYEINQKINYYKIIYQSIPNILNLNYTYTKKDSIAMYNKYKTSAAFLLSLKKIINEFEQTPA